MNAPRCRHLPHQLETYAQMVPKVEVVQHVDDVVRCIGVLLTQFVENANFDERLDGTYSQN